MPTWLPFLSYPPPNRTGFWSPTATIYWCEEEYYASHYVAELVNTVTNLFFIYLGYRGVLNCRRNDHDRVFLYAFVSYMIIGIGSFLFHATLKYEMQLLDELAMIYTTCILFFSAFEYGRSQSVKIALAILVTTTAVLITAFYLYLVDPKFHQDAFTIITVVVLLRSIYLMEITLRPAFRARDGSIGQNEQQRRDQRDEKILKTMWWMIPCGVLSVGIGFLLWNLDNIYCSNLRRWRRQIGLPWGMLLEGHGWWHLWTGISEYYNIQWCVWLRYAVAGKQDDVVLVWPSLWSLPYVERKQHKR